MRNYNTAQEEAIRRAIEPFAPSDIYLDIEVMLEDIDAWADAQQVIRGLYGLSPTVGVAAKIDQIVRRRARTAKALTCAADMVLDDPGLVSAMQLKAAELQNDAAPNNDQKRQTRGSEAEIPLRSLAWIWERAGNVVKDQKRTKEFLSCCAVPVLPISDGSIRAFVRKYIKGRAATDREIEEALQVNRLN